MRRAAAAIGWELFRHHRIGFALLAAYIVGFWLVRQLLIPDKAIRFHPPNDLAAFFIAPLTIGFLFFVGAFSHGLSGDLGARESNFPRRMFMLPVRTIELAGWPMLYGTLASATFWIAALLLAHAAGGVKGDLASTWPALAIAAFIAWMQALTWLSYPMRGMRIVVAILVLLASDAAAVLAIEFHAPESTMIAILAPQIVAAYLIGYRAVVRARSGDMPGGSRWLDRAGDHRRRAAFSSPARAQAWIEWRMHGWRLPAMVFFVVPCELLMLFLPGNDRTGIVFFILFVVLITPPFLAMMAAPGLSGFSTHVATRPMTSAQLVAAKLGMTMWSAAAAWALTIVFTVAGLMGSGTIAVVADWMRDFEEFSGRTRAIGVPILVVAASLAATWKNLVQSLCVGLTDRPWAIKTSALMALVLVVVTFPSIWLVVRNDKVQSFVWDWLGWMLVALVWIKVCAAAWIAIRLHDRRVLPPGAIVGGAMSWLAAVAMVYGMFAWLLASPIVPSYFLGAIAILLVPIARLSAAPLALAWNRHR